MNFDNPAWLYAAVAAVSAAAAAASYALTRQRLKPKAMPVLIALRAAAMALLILCLLNPARTATQIEQIRPAALLLIDRSQSMSIEDQNGQTRWDAALDAAKQAAQRLQTRFDLRIYAFSDALQRIDLELPGQPDGRSTDILSAVAEANAAAAGAPVAGTLLFSDGAQNAGPAQRVRQTTQAPILAAGVGDPNPPKDIAVANAQTPPVMFIGEQTEIHVEVNIRGYPKRETLVSLFRNDALIETQTVAADSDSEQFRLVFNDTPRQEGSVRYAARVSPADGELTLLNNERAATAIVMRGRIRALFIDGTPRHEFAAVRRAVGGVPNIQLESILLAPPSLPSDSIPAQTGRYPLRGSENADLIPQRLETIDLFILGAVPPSRFPTGFAEALVRAVEERGAGAAWLADETWLNGSLRLHPAAPLIPVSPAQTQPQIRGGDFMPQLTDAGRRHPVTQLKPILAENDRAWSQMPLWTRLYSGFEPKPGAETLLISARTQEPVIAVQRAGAGKCLLLATDASWVWGRAAALENDGEQTFQQLWAQIARWLATPAAAKQTLVSSDKRNYAAGDTARIEIRAYMSGFQPADNADIDAAVIDPNGTPAALPISPSENESGVYETYVQAALPGEYRVEATASVGGVTLGSDETAFNAEAPQLEFNLANRNAPFLEQLAEQTGGRYADIADAETLLPLFQEKSETREIQYRESIWDAPLTLLLIAGLLGAEWTIRKRNGLA